jgi:hypothetical protein
MKRALRLSARVAIVLAASVAVMIPVATVSADDPLISQWKPDGLRIDGVITDWPAQTFVSKEVAASVVNDSQDLYVLVATGDSAVITQLTRAGLIVYLDPKGGKGRTFGVRIPPLGSRLAPGNAPSGRGDEPPLLTYFDVLGPGDDDIRRVDVQSGSAIDLRIGSHDGGFFLELKVPLISNAKQAHAPGITLAKREAGLGIVTPDPPRVVRPNPGGRGGMIMGDGGGMMLPPPEKGKSLNIWKRVMLAKAR